MKAIVTFSEVAGLQTQASTLLYTQSDWRRCVSQMQRRQSDCVYRQSPHHVTDAAAPVRLCVPSECASPHVRGGRQALCTEAGIALLQASPCTRQRVPTLTLVTLARFVARGMTHAT
jgi:hypothetical protein